MKSKTACKTNTPNNYESSTFIAKLNFSWIYPLLKVGTETWIQESHLPNLSLIDSSEFNRCMIENLWNQEVSSGRRNLARALFSWYLKETWRAQILMLINMASRLGQAVTLGMLMEVFGKFASSSDSAANDATDSKEGYLYAVIIILCGMIAFPTKQHQFFETYRVGMRIRVGLVAAIFAKTLRLPSVTTGSGNKITPGHVTNLASNDVERFLQTSVTITFLLHGPWIAIAILIIGINSVGPIFSVGYGFLLLLLPIQIYLSKKFVVLRSQVASITDARVGLISQAITGARVMKMNGWEEEFYLRINKVRANETDKLLSASRLKATNEAIYYFSAPVISVLIFIIHVLTGGTLSPKIVYTTLTLMSIVQFIITKHIPSAIMGLSECLVSCKRIQAFFELDEQRHDNIMLIPGSIGDDKDADVIKLENVSSNWDFISSSETHTKENREAISNVQLRFKPGTLYYIIGKVGSGKSALLQTIAGELPISSGTFYTKNIRMGYAPQDPWIMNGSIVENILMGNTMDSDWYRRVVNACGLDEDIARFQHGEETEVGDRGVQLSGGQRGRIGLARALYMDADVLLLDDPLSAVDAKVGTKMYHSAIHELAVKRGRCVILVTHQHHFVDSSVCILMDNGIVRSLGSFRQCVEASNGDLSEVVQVQSCENLQEVLTDKEEPESSSFETNTKKENEFQNEKRQTGIIARNTWLQFGKELGGVRTYVLFFTLFASTQCCMLTTIVLVGKWSEKLPEQQLSTGWVALMIALTASLVFISFLRAVLSFRVFVCTSKRLHNSVLHCVLRAKIEFFDTNPLGRIVNRFSADIGTADETFPLTVYDFLVGVFVVLGSIVTVASVLPFMILFLPPLIWFFLRLRKIFIQTSRELKRIEGLSRSPIFALLSESLNGIDTIRVNRKLEFFKNKFECSHNMHTRAYFAFVASSRWFAFHLDILSFALMATASIFAVLFHDQGWFSVDASILGLALTLLIQISTTNFPWIVRQSAEVSNQMVSIERLLEYKAVESEGALKTAHDDEHPFPQTPSIKFQSFTTRYRSNLPPVLSDISFHVDGGTKVGVVGRTGSGKSSLVQSLFRILEAESGCIEIDNVDISKLGLHKLRHALSVIPQTPVLFGGYTIRENLDPFQKYSDDEIWASLKDVQMCKTVNDMPDTLNAVVVDCGLNFSVGQRQLLCLARALLKKSKILILDEPTANVDRMTDSLVQKTLREKFQNATIISIAHRLETIINYDMILVLGDGKVLEYSSPSALLSDVNGHFTSMLKSTGESIISPKLYHGYDDEPSNGNDEQDDHNS